MISHRQRHQYDGSTSPTNGFLHVLDLPQLYTKPPAQALLDTLRRLTKSSSTFDNDPSPSNSNVLKNHIDPPGVPRYLTDIVSSSLHWLHDNDKERVWELASLRLSERSGRSAAPSMTRSFRVDDNLILNLYEPSLTGDSLGLKTWTSSLLLARRLKNLLHHFPKDDPRILELGSGTGLVGLAAASMWRGFLHEVLLTDLPEIVPNLSRNIELNSSLLAANSQQTVKIHSRILDWTNEADVPDIPSQGYPLVIAADPIYSDEHPKILVDTIKRWLKPAPYSRFILELPLREGYASERDDLRRRLEEFMLLTDEGTETGLDDWEDSNGELLRVECWWSVWLWKENT